MYELYNAGRFGNRPRSWSFKQLVDDPPNCKVSARRKDKIGVDPMIYGFAPDEVVRCIRESSVNPDAFSFTEAIDHHNQFQGEWDGESLTFTTADGPMKIAMQRECQHAIFATARLVLKTSLDPGDYEWLCELAEAFPGHVIEFTSLSRPFGVLNRRMVVWEVRAY